MKTSSNFIHFVVCTLILLSAPMAAIGGVHSWAEQSVLAEGTWLKVALTEKYDGIYQISYAQLRSWGFNRPELVGVYGYGGHMLSEALSEAHLDDLPEVAVKHDAAHQRLLFYGQGTLTWQYRSATLGYVHRQHPYATTAYYFLHQKGGDAMPLALDTVPSTSGTPAITLTDYDECWLYESELKNIGQSGREMYGESFAGTADQTFTLPGAAQKHLAGHTLKAGTTRLTVNFVVKASGNTTFSAIVGGKSIATQSLSAGTGSYTWAAEGTLNTRFDQGDLNRPAIRIVHNTSKATVKLARLNYIRLQGKAALSLGTREPFLLFSNHEAATRLARYSLSGMTDQTMVWEVTDPVAPKVQPTQMGEAEGEQTFVAGGLGQRQYAIVNLQSTAFPTVSRVGFVDNQNLHALQDIDLIIVTAPAYTQQAIRLADYRSTYDDMNVLVVTPDQIYNEYSSGVPDATAIRLLCKQLYDRDMTQPGKAHYLRYLLLMGDTHYDNRSVAQSRYLLPCYEMEASLSETASTVCDDYFAFLDDDEGGHTDTNGRYTITTDKMDIGVGRLPVSNLAQAEALVDKILDYSRNRHYGSWKNRLCFVSDDDKMDASGTDSPNLHMKHNEQLVKSLQKAGHHEFVYQKIYLPAYQQTATASGTDYPTAIKEFYTTLQQGALLVNFAGHGAAGSITHEQMLNNTKAQQLRSKQLPLYIFASCDVQRFDADAMSMAEDLLLNANGGAIATIGAARVVYATQNLTFNQALINNMFGTDSHGRHLRLGDMMRLAKVALGSDYNKMNYSLLGDPSMLLSYPQQQLKIDEVTYGDTIRISGHVLTADGSAIDTTFHGLLYPTVYGAEETITADKGLYQDPVMTFTTRNRKVFTGRDIVRNGQFAFDVVLPNDMPLNTDKGLVNLYACSEEAIEANGYYNDFRLDAIPAGSQHDTIGPQICHLFLDNPDFRSGDCVGATPFFFAEVEDASGFNTTGSTIGHNLVLNIRCISNPLIASRQYVLNDCFTTYTGNTHKGNVKYSLNAMDEGEYEGTFRIWDACGNPATASFRFRVSSQQAPRVLTLQAYPSPVSSGEVVTFRALHNRPESAERLQLQVYTQTGTKVLDQTISSSSSEVVYLRPEATANTQTSNAMNADETSQLMGSSTLQWTVNVPPGIYMYRAFFSSGGAETQTKAKTLIVK